MLAMLSSLWALSVLLLQLGAQGARMTSAGELPPCQFSWQVPGADCYVSSNLAGLLPPCQFRYQRAGIDCKLSTPETKVSWFHCLKCLEIIYTCGCIIGELLIAAPRTQTLNFYNIDSNVPTILADYSTPTETKTLRLWKTGYGDPRKYTELNVTSGRSVCDSNTCLASLHNCWMCFGHEPPPGAGKAAIMSASYDFDTGLAPFYDVAVETSVKTETVRLWKTGSSAVGLPVGRWRANFTLGEENLEISFLNEASVSGPRYGGRILPPCNFEHIRRGLDCLP